jgi:hypothetical protein
MVAIDSEHGDATKPLRDWLKELETTVGAEETTHVLASYGVESADKLRLSDLLDAIDKLYEAA